VGCEYEGGGQRREKEEGENRFRNLKSVKRHQATERGGLVKKGGRTERNKGKTEVIDTEGESTRSPNGEGYTTGCSTIRAPKGRTQFSRSYSLNTYQKSIGGQNSIGKPHLTDPGAEDLNTSKKPCPPGADESWARTHMGNGGKNEGWGKKNSSRTHGSVNR